MICKKCGLETFDNSINCINCGVKIKKSWRKSSASQNISSEVSEYEKYIRASEKVASSESLGTQSTTEKVVTQDTNSEHSSKIENPMDSASNIFEGLKQTYQLLKEQERKTLNANNEAFEPKDEVEEEIFPDKPIDINKILIHRKKAILALILLPNPFSIRGLKFSFSTSKKIGEGDLQGAMADSKKALHNSMSSLVISGIIIFNFIRYISSI